MDERAVSSSELSALTTLLAGSSAACTALASQLQGLLVRQIDNQGSLALRPTGGTPALVCGRVPVEGLARTRDGIEVQVLLHVVDGLLHELELLPDSPETRTSLDELQITEVFRHVT